jgi:hypothetical protein
LEEAEKASRTRLAAGCFAPMITPLPDTYQRSGGKR